jgi:hypothetical protein
MKREELISSLKQIEKLVMFSLNAGDELPTSPVVGHKMPGQAQGNAEEVGSALPLRAFTNKRGASVISSYYILDLSYRSEVPAL